MQPVFSFKLRGAYNKIGPACAGASSSAASICASAGNHAQGVALSAAKLGCRAVIVMPDTTPGIKIDAVKRPRRRGGAGRRLLRRRLRQGAWNWRNPRS